MGWLAKIFRAVPESSGIRLNLDQPFWGVWGMTDFPNLLRALMNLLPEDSILYFEAGHPDKWLKDFLVARAIQEQVHIVRGTSWPRPLIFHIPATQQNIIALAQESEDYNSIELAIHFLVYHHGRVLLEWYDAFFDDQPMLLSGKFLEDKIRAFSAALSMRYKRWSNMIEYSASLNRQ
jgi:hypothetical protein